MGTLLINGFPLIDEAASVVGFQQGVADVPALRAVLDHNQYDIIGVQSPAPGGIFMFNATSMTPDDGTNVIKPNDIGAGSPGRWIKVGAGGGVASNTDTIQVPFLFNTASPLLIRTMSAGETIVSAEIQITVPSDDLAATLELGTPGTPGLILDSTKPNFSAVGVYGTNVNFPFSGADTIQLTITPGTSTQGAGFVILQTKL